MITLQHSADKTMPSALSSKKPKIPHCTINWNHTVPKDKTKILKLLTISGIAVDGLWSGSIGQHFSGWADTNVLPASFN